MWIKFPVKIPAILKKLLKGLHFSMPAEGEKILYLTFDDGPLPGLCPWILSCLKEHQAKATFFLVGQNAERNPELVQQILEEGHSIGNHTQNHLNGFKTKTSTYLQNIGQCAELLDAFKQPGKPMFRPPYGRIRPAQIREIRKAGYEIVMWDVLSKDYDPGISPVAFTGNVLRNSRPGSILVFHDNLKAEKTLRSSLPGILAELSKRGYRFEALHFPLRQK